MTFGDVIGIGPTLIVFVRQFACAGCSERMAELLMNVESLRTSAVNVVVVGCGTVEHARELGGRLALDTRPITLVTDPTLAIHRAAGLVRSHWGVLGAKAMWNLVRAMAHGHENAWGHGDFFQLGGTLLLDKERRVVTHHEERHLGESLPLGDIVDQALALLADDRRVVV
jgi:hypothetical protein